MKKNNIIILSLLQIIFLTSCSNNLSETVYSEILDENYKYALTCKCTIGMWKNSQDAVS